MIEIGGLCVLLQLTENLSRQVRIDDLLYQQETLKGEMVEAKRHLMIPSDSWNFECEYSYSIISIP